MKRALVFLLLAPTLVVVAWLIDSPPAKTGLAENIRDFCAVALFCFTFIVSTVTWPIDGYLARALSIPLRAPLTAIVGAGIAVGLLLALDRMMFPHGTMPPQWILMPFAIGGALCMGACSLLSNDYESWQRLAMRRG